METSQPLTYKIVVAGATGVGKSCFLRRHRSGEFVKEHIPTMGVEVHPLVFHTTRGPVTFKMWDLAGAPEYAGLGDGYYQGAHGLLVLFDLTAPQSLFTAVAALDEHLRPAGEGGAPLAAVLCRTKVDLYGSDGSGKPSKPYSKVPYYEISARSCYNYEKPFLSLARQLTGDAELHFSDAPAVMPPEVPVDPALLAAWQGGAPCLVFDPEEREFAYHLGAHTPRDQVINEIRETLAEILEGAGQAGYDADVCVLLSFHERATASQNRT